MSKWQDTNSYAVTVRLWPEAAQMEQGRQFRAVETIVRMLYLLPFAVIGLIWGFIDGFIGGWVLAWLYNKLAG